MDEDSAKAWVRQHFGERAVERLALFADLVVAENERQNLIAASTVPTIWSRHIVDSAQLIELAPDTSGTWLDVGTGGGFPGMVVALLRSSPMLLVEPRRKRTEFLNRVRHILGLSHVSVLQTSVERVTDKAAIISARAVASMASLIDITIQCATKETVWLLPRGRYEEPAAREGMMFHVKQSVTNPGSCIVITTPR